MWLFKGIFEVYRWVNRLGATASDLGLKIMKYFLFGENQQTVFQKEVASRAEVCLVLESNHLDRVPCGVLNSWPWFCKLETHPNILPFHYLWIMQTKHIIWPTVLSNVLWLFIVPREPEMHIKKTHIEHSSHGDRPRNIQSSTRQLWLTQSPMNNEKQSIQ